MLVYTILVVSTLKFVLCCRLSHEEENHTPGESAAQCDGDAPKSVVANDQSNLSEASHVSKTPTKDMSVREIDTVHDDKRERTSPEEFAGKLRWIFHVYYIVSIVYSTLALYFSEKLDKRVLLGKTTVICKYAAIVCEGY